MDDLNAAISLNDKFGVAYVSRSQASRAARCTWDAESEDDLKLALAHTGVEIELISGNSAFPRHSSSI